MDPRRRKKVSMVCSIRRLSWNVIQLRDRKEEIVWKTVAKKPDGFIISRNGKTPVLFILKESFKGATQNRI